MKSHKVETYENASDGGEKNSSQVLLSCSVEETNKLREKLGLPLLKTTKKNESEMNGKASSRTSSDSSLQNKPKNKEENDSDELISSKARDVLLQEPDIASTADPSDMNVYSWIAKSKGLEKMKQNKKSSLTVAAFDKEEEDEEDVLPDLRVAHHISSFETLKPGEDVILTLEDSCILNTKGGLQENEPILENPSLSSQERRLKSMKPHKYDPLESYKASEPSTLMDRASKNVLEHYDGGDSFNEKGNLDSTSTTRPTFTLSEIKRMQEKSQPSPQPLSLTSTHGLQSDFMNAKEVEEYQRKKELAKLKEMSLQKKKFIEKMNKRKRQQDSLLNDKDIAEDGFLLPLLSQTRQAATPIIADDVDLDNALLYTQLSKRLPRLVDAIEEKRSRSGFCSETGVVKSKKEKEDPAAVVLQNVSLLESNASKQEDNRKSSVEHDDDDEMCGVEETNPVRSPEKAVEFSDITEFCRSLETPLEKLETMKENAAVYHHGLALGKTCRQKSWQVDMSEDDIVAEDMASSLGNEEVPPEDGVTEEEKRIIHQVLDEEVLDGGLVSALNFLKSRGELNTIPGRRCRSIENVPLHMDSKPNDVKLEYKDEYGRVMTPKEAFRYISWIFHGKGPGKKKKEKMLRKMELEKKLKGIASNTSQLPTVKALQKQQKKGQAHLVLSRIT